MTTSVTHPLLRHWLVALLLFAPLVDGGATYVPATVVRLVALALAIAWLWQAASADGAWRHVTPVDLPIALFLILAALSTVVSPDRYTSLQGFLSLAAGALVFAVAAEVARGAAGRRWIVGTVMVTGIAQAILILAHHAGSAGRPPGTYFNPNYVAMALAMAGALLLALRPATRVGVAGLCAAMAVVGGALLATGSRGGVLAAAAGWSAVGWRRWRWKAAVVAAMSSVLVLLVPNPFSARLRDLSADDPLAYTRLQVWRSAIDRAIDHPFGVGLNLFGQSSQQYAFPIEAEVARYGRRAESAHNDYLQVLAELGPLGFALALWVLGALAVAARAAIGPPSPGEGDSDARPLALGAAGALGCAAVQAAVDTPLHVPALVVQVSALAGVVLASRPAGPLPAVPAWLATLPRTPARVAFAAVVAVASIGVASHGLAYFAYQRALAARDAGDAAGVAAWLDRAVAIAPGSALYHDARAAAALAAFTRSGDPREAAAAEEAMLRAIALDGEDAQRYARLAQLYRAITPADHAIRQRTLKQAVAALEEAERLDPHTAMFVFERAEALVKLDDRWGAIQALERAVQLEPRFLAARLNLARLLAAVGDVAAARSQYAAIEATLARFDSELAHGPLAKIFLAIDRAAVRREAAALPGASG